jgi:hypothetical protein
MASRTGQIFPSTKKRIRDTSYKNDDHSVDWFAVDEKKVVEAKEQNMK